MSKTVESGREVGCARVLHRASGRVVLVPERVVGAARRANKKRKGCSGGRTGECGKAHKKCARSKKYQEFAVGRYLRGNYGHSDSRKYFITRDDSTRAELLFVRLNVRLQDLLNNQLVRNPARNITLFVAS
ncbi:hypothetical protein J6590_020804 [Homalodisca vitripennis]|nr:hypothetical protein J6590_020804 [Homalodisca vitripennis]